jgi:outer membrane usher protein
MGADVFDSAGNEIGMVGQGGQIYARVEDNTGKLTVKWGAGWSAL